MKCHKFTDVTGGSTLYIETTVTRPLSKLKADSEGAVTLTGNLGDVMKESTKIAHTFAKSFLAEKQPDNELLQRAHVNLHVPEVSEQTSMYTCPRSASTHPSARARG